MKRLLSLIFVLSNISLYSMEPNYHVIVSTSDQQEYTLPRWKVRESNTLYTTFLEKLQECPDVLPVCFATPTLSHGELHAYSTALDQEDFDNYYKYTLTPDQQRLLTNAVGQHARDHNDELIPKLYDVAMSTKILSLYCDQAMLIKNIFHWLPVWFTLDHKQRLHIIEKATHKTYTQTTKDYSNDGAQYQSCNGDFCNYLPIQLTRKPNEYKNWYSAFFTGRTNTILLEFNNTTWDIEQCIRNQTIEYMVTPAEPEGTPTSKNIKKIWAFDYAQNTTTLLKEVTHKNSINRMVFSKDGKLLALSSKGKNSEGMLSLISLEMENNGLKNNANMYLTHHPGWFNSLCFNSQSTLLAAGIANTIVFWNTITGAYVDALICPGKQIYQLCFNYDDTILAIGIGNYHINSESHKQSPSTTIIALYDISNPENITLINTVEKSCEYIATMHFSENQLLVGTTEQALLIDGLTGNIIMQTPHFDNDSDNPYSFMYPVLMPNVDILATALRTSTGNNCNTQLWDTRSGNLLSTIIEHGDSITGIGITPNCTSVITTYANETMTQTDFVYEDPYNNTALLTKLKNLFQLYCLHRLDRAKENNDFRHIMIDRQSLFYKGIKTLPQHVKDVMYNIFHMLHAYGTEK